MTKHPIRLLEANDVKAYVEHIGRHATESGGPGDVHFMPYDSTAPFDAAASGTRRARCWTIAPGTPEWHRMWGVFDGEQLVGHCELNGDFVPSMLHRAGLGMGMERPYRRRGLGQRLLEIAIEWAIAQPFLEWIDLGVFNTNPVAQQLYQKFGFVETGRIEDRFRLDGQKVSDISMTLELRTLRG